MQRFLIIFILILTSCSQQTINLSASGSLFQHCDWEMVTKVYDGDTIKLQNGNRVRYIGIDSPEMNENPVDPFAIHATQENEKLTLHKTVCLIKDNQTDNEDTYGRLLRYIYLEDGTFINKILVEKGLAKAYTMFPFEKSEEFITMEQEAQNQLRGLWGTTLNSNINSSSALSSAEAKEHYNENTSVQFTVLSSHDSGKAIFLNSESNYKNENNFTVVIFYNSKNTFIKAGIENPAHYYLHKTIQVSGKIQKYQGKPEIIVSSPTQLIIVP